MGDPHILDLFFSRSESALVLAREAYGRLCLATARRILPDERDAEECVSDALLRAWNAIPPERPGSLGAWLARVTRNLALDRYDYNRADRRSSALTTAFEELEPWLAAAGGGPEAAAEAGDFRRFLNQFLRRQPTDSRSFFIRRYFYGESIREIAEAFQVSEEKVKSSLFRTRSRLRGAMEKEGIAL